MEIGWLIEELDEVIYLSDPETYEILFVNRACRKDLGLDSPDDYLGKPCYKVLQNRDEPCPFCTNHLLKPDETYVWEHQNQRVNRHYLLKDKLISYQGRPMRMEVALDITDRETVSRELSEKLAVEQAIVSCTRSLTSAESLEKAIALVLQSIGEFYRADRAYIFEIDHQKDICKNTYEWCGEGVAPEMEFLQDVDMTLLNRWMPHFEQMEPVLIPDLEAIKVDSPEEYCILSMQNIKNLITAPFTIDNILMGYVGVDNPRAYAGNPVLLQSLAYFIANEITKRRMISKHTYLNYHDPLTGLLNRNSYIAYLESRPEERLQSLGVVVADINGLKQINERFGHSFGDGVVATTGSIMQEFIEERILFRLSGDEIVGFAENTDIQQFVYKIRQMQEILERRVLYGVTIGYTWSDTEINVQNLVTHADELMFIQKQEFYKNFDSNSKHANHMSQTALLEEVARGSFRMYLQPKCDISSGKVVGAEALVRFRDKTHGLITPDKFIPLLEKERLIRYVDLFIYEQVLKQMKAWQQQGKPLFPISLNFSRITLLDADLMKEMLEIYSRYDSVPKNFVQIELTETIGEVEREIVFQIGKSIRDQGFQLGLDDFGSQYSSMSLLTFMEFDTLKLDKSLIWNLETSPSCRTMVKCIIDMCREMGMECLAEGVETEEQLALLKNMDCTTAQGYLYSKPLPADEFGKIYL
ncbi:MAG: hypothetical protein DBY45_10805 [Clostridiales bacterium]|nr:MAG: hypothetical protein DBY45_10805 [Clostridiales bacterium]